MSGFDAVAVGRRVLGVQSRALADLSVGLDDSFNRAVEILFAAKGKIVCTGMGKSGHVARKIAATLASTGSPALFVHPAEASHGDLGMVGAGDVVLALTAAPDSALGRAADLILLLPDAPEGTSEVSAPTTSTTLQMALGDALAVALLERRGFTAGDFRVFHPGGTLGAMLRTVRDVMHGRDDTPLVAPDVSMREALLVMTEKRFGCVGVVDADGKLAGIITDGDLRRHIDGLFDHTAREVMTPAPKSVPPGLLAVEALKRMTERAPSSTVLFVVDAGRPVGILHIHDLVRAGVI